MAVTISGMFGDNKTYFADSPVVIDISGLYWGKVVTSPFTIVRVEVIYDNKVVGEFKADTGGQSSTSFDISSALRVIWAGYNYSGELSAAANPRSCQRDYRAYSLRIYTEYLASDDGGVYTETICEDEHGNTTIPGGQCLIGHLTEWERKQIVEDPANTAVDKKANADVSYWEGKNPRNGDASTKPDGSPERVGSMSITSWVDVHAEGTQSVFYPANAATDPSAQYSTRPHAPLVLRDSQPYVDFLFVNRRGAVETCSGLTLESMGIDVNVQQYARVERPSFKPSRSLMAIGQDGRRSWQMSSGYVTREWAEWWAMEFLGGKRKQWWMRYPLYDPNGRWVPVIIQPSKQSISIYDRSKQQLPHVDFTVTMALEG